MVQPYLNRLYFTIAERFCCIAYTKLSQLRDERHEWENRCAADRWIRVLLHMSICRHSIPQTSPCMLPFCPSSHITHMPSNFAAYCRVFLPVFHTPLSSSTLSLIPAHICFPSFHLLSYAQTLALLISSLCKIHCQTVFSCDMQLHTHR